MKLLLTLATLLTAACSPPFIVAKEEGPPFIEQTYHFSLANAEHIARMSEKFGRKEGFQVNTSYSGSFGVLLERGSLSIFAHNTANRKELFVNAWMRSPEERASSEERQLAKRYIDALGSVLTPVRPARHIR